MPQIPKFPSPYMTTVDANDEIDFSCVIDSKDVISEYIVRKKKLASMAEAFKVGVLSPQEEYLGSMYYYNGTLCKLGTNYTIKCYKNKVFGKLTLIVNFFSSSGSTVTFEDEKNGYRYVTSKSSKYYGMTRYIVPKDITINGSLIDPLLVERIIWNGTWEKYSTKETYYLPFGYFSYYPNCKRIELDCNIDINVNECFRGCTGLEEVVVTAKTGTSTFKIDGYPYDQDTHPYKFVPTVYAESGIRGGWQNVSGDYIGTKKCVIYGDTPDTTRAPGSVESVVYLKNSPNSLPDTSGIGMFHGCKNLESVSGVSNVTSVGAKAFYECVSLTSFFGRDHKIKTIGTSAFQGCTSLKEIVITDDTTSIGSKAFSGCSSLSSIVVTKLESEELTIASDAFDSTGREADSPITIYCYKVNTAVEAVITALANASIPYMVKSLYELDEYTSVPAYGGKNGGSTITYTAKPGELENDCEYVWNITLHDSFGKKITSPDYYFKTRANSEVKIGHISEELVYEYAVEASAGSYIPFSKELGDVMSVKKADASGETDMSWAWYDDSQLCRIVEEITGDDDEQTVTITQEVFETGTYKITYYGNAPQRSSKREFSASYTTNGTNEIAVPIKRHRWTMYQRPSDESEWLQVGDSGDVYSVYLSYTFSKFIPAYKYKLSIEVENNEGVICEDSYEFECVATEASDVVFPTVYADESKNAVVIDASLCPVGNSYSVVRSDSHGNSKRICEMIGKETVYDLTAASEEDYTYYFYCTNSSDEISTSKSSPIHTSWCGVSIIAFDGSYSESTPYEVSDNDIKLFALNTGVSGFTQNQEKTLLKGIGSKYGKINAGGKNYLTFSMEALIGELENDSYESDNIEKITGWNDFVNSPKSKLFVDTKGHVIVCDITSNKYSYDNASEYAQTTINADFAEIASSDNISVIVRRYGGVR